jgi:hypothetical protein
MNNITEVGNEASQTFSELESPARRLFVKGVAGFGAAFASSSFVFAAVPAQSGQQGRPGNEMQPVQDAWGPFTPSSGAGRYLQIVYPPSTTAGELQLGVTYTLWIPDGIQTVRAVIVHQHGASIPAAQSGATSAYDLHWQALAKKWDCVLLGPSYRVLNDAIDLTQDKVLTVSSFGLSTNLRQNPAMLKSLPFPGASGDIRGEEYGPT